MNVQLPLGKKSSPRPDGSPKRIPVAAVVGVVLICLATAMTLPAFIWLIGGGLCGPGASTCNGPADMPLPAVVLVWLSVPFGLVALGLLLQALIGDPAIGGRTEGEQSVGAGIGLGRRGDSDRCLHCFLLVNGVLTEPI